jgi:hypothetical protein
LGGLQFKADPGKKLVNILFHQNKLGMVVHISNPGYMGSIGRRIVVQSQTWAKTKDN